MSNDKEIFLNSHSTTGISGFDPVAYFAEGKAVRGNGHHTVVFDSVTYLFSNERNQKEFEANPQKYLPAYNGYCAYGVSVGKKFVPDPAAWKIVDGKLYLNLDTDIQIEWEKDVPGHINKANANWPTIEYTAPSNL